MITDPDIISVLNFAVKVVVLFGGLYWLSYILATRFDDDDNYR
jgi:hypothetical protein